jgi:hypothetical protein
MKAQSFLDIGSVAVQIRAAFQDDLHLVVPGEGLHEMPEEIRLVVRDENDPPGRVARFRRG